MAVFPSFPRLCFPLFLSHTLGTLRLHFQKSGDSSLMPRATEAKWRDEFRRIIARPLANSKYLTNQTIQ